MNHQPFEQWILAEDALDETRERDLQAHLAECEQCRQLSTSWAQIKEVTQTSTVPDPVPGFTDRWQARLEFKRQERQQRKYWIITLAVFAIASLILSGLFILDVFSASWSYHLSQFIARFSLFAARINHFYNLIDKLTDSFPILIPILSIIGIDLSVSFVVMVTAWFGSLIKLYKPEKEGAVTK